MDWSSVCNLMDSGCCLWVGAGLTVQIAGSPRDAPQWDELTSELEKLSQVQTRPDWDYPKRLEACAQKLGEKRFQALLRKKYYTNLSLVLLKTAKKLLDSDDFIPLSVRQVACLGQVANPIVNFNIEPLSSVLLARPLGPMRLASYSDPHMPQPAITQEASAHFRRVIYHPHGLATGSTVMTKSQYDAQGNTLAFALAVHATFGCDLAVVGMSLEDAYLREQITRFRDDVKSIFWFNSEFQEAPAKWAQANRVDMLPVNWSEFWSWWLKDRGFELDEENLCGAWYRVLSEAWDEVRGGAATVFKSSLASVGLDIGHLKDAEELGEPGQPISEEVAGLSGVVDDVGSRINQKGFALPQIATSFG